MEDIREVYEELLQIKFMARYLAAAGILLLVASCFIWWFFVYTSKYDVWWGMMNNNLAAPSVTKHLVQVTGSTKLDQYIGQQFGAQTMAYGRTTLTSYGNTVKTETLGTATEDFVRYTSIKTAEKKNGKPLDFSSVLNKWAGTPANITGTGSSLPFLEQTTLGLGGGNLLPVANLAPPQRDKLLALLHKDTIFNTKIPDAKRKSLNGRPVYEYSVAVEPVAYVGFEKQFAQDLGLHALDGLDPNSYQGQPPIEVAISVDIQSHTLAEINYAGSDHKEFYSAFGIPLAMNVPKATITAQALQSRIGQIQ